MARNFGLGSHEKRLLQEQRERYQRQNFAIFNTLTITVIAAVIVAVATIACQQLFR